MGAPRIIYAFFTGKQARLKMSLAICNTRITQREIVMFIPKIAVATVLAFAMSNQSAFCQAWIPHVMHGSVSQVKASVHDTVQPMPLSGTDRGVVGNMFLLCTPTRNGKSGFIWNDLPKNYEGMTILSGHWDLHFTIRSQNPDLNKLWLQAVVQPSLDDPGHTVTVTKSFAELARRGSAKLKNGEFEVSSHSSACLNEEPSPCIVRSLAVFSTNEYVGLLGRPGICLYIGNKETLATPAKVQLQ